MKNLYFSFTEKTRAKFVFIFALSLLVLVQSLFSPFITAFYWDDDPGTGCPPNCPPPCVDECDYYGQKICVDSTHYKICEPHPTQPCFVWSSPISCGTGKICQNGQCISSCSCGSWSNWQNFGCGQDSCSADKMLQKRTRDCTPSGCASEVETRCVYNSSCVPVPPAPTGLSCNTVSTSKINVSWNSVSTANGYKVYRCTGTTCSPTSLVRTQTGTFWSNIGLNSDTAYRYRVKAYNSAGDSNYSNTVTCKTDAPIPDLNVTCSANPNPVQVSQTTTFTAYPSGGTGSYSYSWSGDCSCSSTKTCSKSFSSTGNYTATVTVTSGSQTKSASCSVQVNPIPCNCSSWSSWQNKGCGAGSCPANQMYQQRIRTCTPSGCDIEQENRCVAHSSCAASGNISCSSTTNNSVTLAYNFNNSATGQVSLFYSEALV